MLGKIDCFDVLANKGAGSDVINVKRQSLLITGALFI